MNRIIKFRARDTKNNKWITSVPPKEYMIDSDEWDRRDMGGEEGGMFYPANPLGDTFKDRIVYQQFTGLIDINDKEIYEGDIVKQRFDMNDDPQSSSKIEWSKNTWTVVYSETAHRWGLILTNSKWAHSTSHHLPLGKKSNDIEVIGNIYEHNQTLK